MNDWLCQNITANYAVDLPRTLLIAPYIHLVIRLCLYWKINHLCYFEGRLSHSPEMHAPANASWTSEIRQECECEVQLTQPYVATA